MTALQPPAPSLPTSASRASVGAGPQQPQRGVPAPPAGVRMPRAVPPLRAPVFFVSVHGGAGASTLAGLSAGATAVTGLWPIPPAGHAAQLPLVLVARSHFSGLTAAQHAITDWAAGGLPTVKLLGLVVIADAPGRLPRPLRDLIRLLAGGVPQLWQLPWSEDARLGQLTELATAPREHRRLVGDLVELVPALAPTAAPAASGASASPPPRPTASTRTSP